MVVRFYGELGKVTSRMCSIADEVFADHKSQRQKKIRYRQAEEAALQSPIYTSYAPASSSSEGSESASSCKSGMSDFDDDFLAGTVANKGTFKLKHYH